jgi:type IV pilus assembly protein PilE
MPAQVQRPRDTAGVTGVELLVVLVVAAILATAATAAYRQHLVRARRSDATLGLLRLQGAQERYFLQHGHYAGADAAALPPPAGLGLATTAGGHYDLAVTATTEGGQAGYVATATARSDGPQWQDTDCRSFTLDEAGRRGAAAAGGPADAAATARCWR